MFPTANVYRSHVPSTAYGILSAFTSECSGVLPGRVYPLPRPPLQRGVLFDRRVVVADYGVEVLATMPGAHPKLADDLATLFVRRRGLPPRVVAQHNGDVPVERRSALFPTLFRLPNRVGQTFPPKPKVGPNMRAAHRPEAELVGHWWLTRESFNERMQHLVRRPSNPGTGHGSLKPFLGPRPKRSVHRSDLTIYACRTIASPATGCRLASGQQQMDLQGMNVRPCLSPRLIPVLYTCRIILLLPGILIRLKDSRNLNCRIMHNLFPTKAISTRFVMP